MKEVHSMETDVTRRSVFGDVSNELERVREEFHNLLRAEELPNGQGLLAAIQTPGKLLRPGLLLLIGKNHERAEQSRGVLIASALEMLHTATLLHDDVIDQSSVRRQRPTVARLVGNRASILFGDYLFAKSFNMLAQMGEFRALERLLKAIGTCVKGELAEQANLFNFSLTEEEYMNITNMKTAELFAASCWLGSHIHGDCDGECDALSRFGRLFGQGFQIVDDLLDFVGDAGSMGKPSGQDLLHGVVTLPTILALRDASDAMLSADTLGRGYATERELGRAGGPGETLERAEAARVRRMVLESGALRTTMDIAKNCFAEAVESVAGLNRDDGLYLKLRALCEMSAKRGEDALSKFERHQRDYADEQGA